MPENDESKGLGVLLIVFLVILVMTLLAAFTVPFDLLDTTDFKDYSDSAKFFAGEYSAKHRTAHSILYGFMFSPYVKLIESFFLLKFASVFFLVLLILSVYYISGRRPETLFLFLAAPVIWYLAPWFSPAALVTLLVLWSWYFIRKFDIKGGTWNLIYSALLFGLAAAFWDVLLYFSVIMMLSFLYNKKLYFSLLFLAGIFVGLIPKLIVDQYAFGFAFYGVLKHFFATVAFALVKGAFGQGHSRGLYFAIMTLIFIPFFIYLLYKRENFMKHKKSVIFITASIVVVLISNPQLRPLFTFLPIVILLLGDVLGKKQYKIQVVMFLILSLLVVTPYIVQTQYETDMRFFNLAMFSPGAWELRQPFTGELIQKDLREIEKRWPGEVFVVGNGVGDYRDLAHFYWGDGIEEFVSIQDYKLDLAGEHSISERRVSFSGDLNYRREIWVEIGLGRNSNDVTDYDAIQYGISVGKGEDLGLEEFELVEEYEILGVWERRG